MFPCWSKLLCGQNWYVLAITAGPWWWGMLHSDCSTEALPQTLYLIAVCISFDDARARLKYRGSVCCTFVQDTFEWPPMSALWNTSVHLNFYLEDGFARFQAFQIEFVWKICSILLISFRIFVFFPFYIQSSVIWTDTAWIPLFQSPAFDWFLRSIIPVQPRSHSLIL